MKASYLLALATLSLLTMSNSCRKEDVVPCATTLAVLETAQVPGLKAVITEPIPCLDQSYSYVVNSQAEYEALFAGRKLPPVDFTAYTLLAGKTRTATPSAAVAQLVTQTCAGYQYTVQLAAAPGSKPANVTYYVLVPKLPAGAKVAFEVQLPQAAAVRK